MATITSNVALDSNQVTPDQVEEGKLYITAQGRLAYAVTRTQLALFNDPKASIWNSGNGGTDRFPMRLAPAGTSVTITQEGRVD